MLGHPVFRAKIREWLKVLRKANCAVILATQSLSDAARSGILDVLIESCPTKIFLPNEEATTAGTSEHPGPRDLYEAMGLNETQIEIIRTARRRSGITTSCRPKGGGCSTSASVRSRCRSPASAQRNRSHILSGSRGATATDGRFAWLDEQGVDYEALQ